MDIEELGRQIVDSAYQVHIELGPGLLESSYEACLAHELNLRGIKVELQKPQPITYKGLTLDVGYRLDILVEGLIVIELKAVESLLPVHKAQTLSYLKHSGCTLGFLINFNIPLLKDGLRRIVHNHPEQQQQQQ